MFVFRFGDCSLQERINQQSCERLKAYCNTLRDRLPDMGKAFLSLLRFLPVKWVLFLPTLANCLLTEGCLIANSETMTELASSSVSWYPVAGRLVVFSGTQH